LITVLLADDQALVRSAFRVLLDLEEDLTIVGEAADGEEAVALAAQARPDVVLMDISMPGTDGIEATQRIVAREIGAKVLILTTLETDENVFRALRSGASGFLLKDTDPAELVRAIRIVANGEALLAPSVTRRLIVESRRAPRNDGRHRISWSG
jgi:DNA-binding NarL/FixJ family response regulator